MVTSLHSMTSNPCRLSAFMTYLPRNRGSRGISNSDALHTNKLGSSFRNLLAFQAQRDRLFNSVDQFVQRTSLGVAAWKLRHRRDVITRGIAFDDHVEFP